MTIDQGRHRARVGGMPQMDFLATLPRALRSSGLVPQLSRYALVSVLALALDFAIFLALNKVLGLPTLAGVVGYGCGLVLHYQLSRHLVFVDARSQKSVHRLFSEFVASGLIGLAVTAGVIALATGVLGMSAILAKVLAAGASFLGVYVIRRTIVFA